jgi:tetratricopeptide (TPR) repeat protein
LRQYDLRYKKDKQRKSHGATSVAPDIIEVVARIRSLILAAAALGVIVLAQDPPSKPKDPPSPAKPTTEKQDPAEVEPPEEDEALKPKVYTFNPLEAQRDLRTGEFYFRKSSWRAAAKRFEEATLYDPSLADAFLRLGDTREKLHDKKGAKAAYQKYLELKPDSKLAASVKKKIDE